MASRVTVGVSGYLVERVPSARWLPDIDYFEQQPVFFTIAGAELDHFKADVVRSHLSSLMELKALEYIVRQLYLRK